MARINQVKFVFILVIVIAVTFCNNQENTGNILQQTFKTDCSCDSLWSKPSAKDFVALLGKTTLSNHPIWKGYNLGDATFVLNAGQANDSTYCLGLWQKGNPLLIDALNRFKQYILKGRKIIN